MHYIEQYIFWNFLDLIFLVPSNWCFSWGPIEDVGGFGFTVVSGDEVIFSAEEFEVAIGDSGSTCFNKDVVFVN